MKTIVNYHRTPKIAPQEPFDPDKGRGGSDPVCENTCPAGSLRNNQCDCECSDLNAKGRCQENPANTWNESTCSCTEPISG
jgi:hypothetical protein